MRGSLRCGVPGIVAVIHTWSQTLELHPHVHLLLSLVGLSPENKLVIARKYDLLPYKVLRKCYRRHLLALITHEFEHYRLCLPKGVKRADFRRMIELMWRDHKPYNVAIFRRDKWSEVLRTLKYFARSVRGGPIREDRIISVDASGVTFRYVRYPSLQEPDPGPSEPTTHRTIAEFFRLWHEHVVPAGMQIARRLRLYANNVASRARLNLLRELLSQLPVAPDSAATGDGLGALLRDPPKTHKCPFCGQPAQLRGILAPLPDLPPVALDPPRARGPPPPAPCSPVGAYA